MPLAVEHRNVHRPALDRIHAVEATVNSGWIQSWIDLNQKRKRLACGRCTQLQIRLFSFHDSHKLRPVFCIWESGTFPFYVEFDRHRRYLPVKPKIRHIHKSHRPVQFHAVSVYTHRRTINDIDTRDTVRRIGNAAAGRRKCLNRHRIHAAIKRQMKDRIAVVQLRTGHRHGKAV